MTISKVFQLKIPTLEEFWALGNTVSAQSIATSKTGTIQNESVKTPKNDDLKEYKLANDVIYFVLHSTAAIVTQAKAKEYIPSQYIYAECWHGHTYIFDNGEFINIVPYSEKARATKAEWEDYYKTQLWGKNIHIEIVYAKNGKPTEAQYQTLALLYNNFYKKNNKKLIIIPHKELDRGIPAGHSDPENFDIAYFYGILKTKYSIIITEGTEGISVERFNASTENNSEMKRNFPPLLLGPIEDIRGNLNRKWI